MHDDPTSIRDLFAPLMEKMGIDPQTLADPAEEHRDKGACQALQAHERWCRDGYHSLDHLTSRRCPMVRVRAEAVRLANPLGEYCKRAVHPDSERIDHSIMRSYSPVRPVRFCMPPDDRMRPVSELRNMIAEYVRGKALDHHLGIYGPCGNGKSMLLDALHFSLLYRGVNSVRTDMMELLRMGEWRRSRDQGERQQAEDYFRRCKAARVFFIVDLGLRKADRAQYPFGADLLWELKESIDAPWCWDSNLRPAELDRHPDVGERVGSRITGIYKGKRALLIRTDGPDQRQVEEEPHDQRDIRARAAGDRA